MKQETQFGKIYKQFQYGNKYNRTEILKSLKGVIVSSRTYHDFSNEYFKSININAYKQPNKDDYPIITNYDIIPLSKRRTERSPQVKTSRNSQLRLGSNVLVTETTGNSHTSRNRKHHHHVLSLPTLDNIDPPKKYHKNLLREMIFDDPFYEKLIYDESCIFHRESIYSSFIQKKIDELKHNYCNNTTYQMKKSFCNGKVILKMQSMTLEFTNMTDQSKKPISFNIPFAYIPLFYYKDFDNIKYILLSVITFDKDYENITFDDEGIYHLLKTSAEYSTPTSMSALSLANNDLIRHQTIDYTLCRTQTNVEGLENNLLYKSKLLTPRTVVKPLNVINTKSNNNTEGLMPSTYYNIIQKTWITPKYIYQFQLKMPKITIAFTQAKKQVTKIVDPELMLFILMNNFLQWDFYVVNYLLSLKAFRWSIEQILSKARIFDYKDNDYIKTMKTNEIMKMISIKTVNGVEFINLSKRHICIPNERDNTYHFYQTDRKLKNSIMIFHSYSLVIYSHLMQSNNEFLFDFNFNQLKMLYEISQSQSLQSFLNKITTVCYKNDTIKLNYEIFDHLKMANIDKDDKSLLCMNDNSTCDIKQINKELNMSIALPYLEKIDYVKEIHVQGSSIISDTTDSIHRVILPDVLRELTKNEMSKWGEILCSVKGGTLLKTSTMNLSKENIREHSLRTNQKHNSKLNQKSILSTIRSNNTGFRLTLQSHNVTFKPLHKLKLKE